MEFDKIAVYTCFAIYEVGGIQSVFVESFEEAGCYLCEMVLSIFSDFLHLAHKLLEEVFLFHDGIEILGSTLVVVAEDVLTEMLDFTDDIPTFVISNVRLDVVHDPVEQAVGFSQVFYQLVYSLLFHLIVVESYAQVGCKVEFPCQVTQYALKKRIDSLHPEVIVVVYQEA